MIAEHPPASVPDFAALRHCWHPVAYTHAVKDTPHHTRLLGEDLVIWRDSGGTPHALRDLCIHRGTALSLGRVVGDRIMCPYHGWQYGSDGVCTHIPQLEDPTKVPGKARVDAFATQERYGHIWVALETPARYDLPDIPELDDPDWVVVQAGPYAWNADASRQLENFTDFGHFPWVHPGLLGDPERPVVPDYSVTIDDHILRYDIVRPEAPNSDDFPVFGNETTEAPTRRSRYQLHLPYTILLRLGWGGEKGMVYFFASQPVDEDHCAGYVTIARNYDREQPASVLQDFEDTIFNQDQVVVESQRPERVPFDLAAEMHMKFDAVAINYRKAMREQGLAKRPA
ncbi:aromatic ring-hydroxylating dioxygenase subunit alpha [Solirubrobacter ginsenosidimutans]|uniref:Aromatic ring-hydroxylating dioxygenase subunit alpha n=1 Tax=Solirubrobacter ginsenosidimutans TaxID=490573 RepID=A0A9X3S2H7_9ACTN|nr:aromatic ring-hydroxylating dioxygenase subunit alpha [Solirubrobacter ginsenosidimutans]MDA0162317.1 aromatic ring-hydroxylating dioxygenase subunit alpha [Solirubrobacter ginsenosidimutans]